MSCLRVSLHHETGDRLLFMVYRVFFFCKVAWEERTADPVVYYIPFCSPKVNYRWKPDFTEAGEGRFSRLYILLLSLNSEFLVVRLCEGDKAVDPIAYTCNLILQERIIGWRLKT